MNEFATSDFDDNEPGGSTFDQNTIIDLAGQKNLSDDNSDFIALNNPAGNTSQNYVDPGAYSVDASGKYTGLTNLANIKKFVSDNKEMFGLAGAVAGMMSPGAQYGKTGYQGSIPQLLATRKMVSAPPTRAQGYRPGAGGINYGGDVTYSALPKDTALWSQLSGNSGTAAGANLTPVKDDVVTNTGGLAALTPAQQEAQAVSNWRKSLTQPQLLSQINQYIAARPNMTTAELQAVLSKFQITPAELQSALASNSGMSAADRYALSHGQGLAEANAAQTAGITKWIQDNPYATSKQIADAIKFSGVNEGEIKSALAGSKLTPAYQAALLNGVGPDQLYKNILDYQRGDHTSQEIADIMATSGVTQADIDAAQAYAANKGYAEGGMAKGRYLQGETDGMADEIPAQIGQDQPAALSHGEFVIPADVVSHMGNGNSDAGAKKLYQMMDKIRMARTGNKKQGKKINPDKFMPGGLAAAYAAGGKVKKYETGGSVVTNPGIAGVESSLSNWAGDYTTNMLGQGQALANMPYQQYMGPLTAGPSSLQNKVFEGLEKTTFPSNLGGTFSSSGAYAPPTMGSTVGSASTPSAGGTPITASQPAASTGIASQYMNPYLQSVLTPQMDEMRRQSQINLQPALGKLTQAGGLGGGRQAIMESEANRNLLQEQNKTLGQGYAAAYDKGMQQFNTEQAQAKGLADLLSTQGGIQRGIESEGIAADKSAFEEARANPYKMVQFQQSLLQGLPLEAKSYTGIQQSDLVKAAQGATTVNQLLKNLGLIT